MASTEGQGQGALRARTIALALLAAVVAVVATFVWMVENRPPPPFPVVARTPTAEARSGVQRPTTRAPDLPAAQSQSEATLPPTPIRPAPVAAGVPTPGVFDFGAMTPQPQQPPGNEEERFVTNDRFTQEDLQHPERYFEAAETTAELNRPEERRAVLQYFVAYREKLEHDLADEEIDAETHQEIAATMQRYDDAITRLRALIDAEP